ncbi:MAG: TIGR03620 family F420-dependent LLM class oxidoreductase [Thermoleophilia bacterium]|nr:TIGR03620 family F420-dependent LLM class oxidoreductase [Thermoleophilia bacterium]
MGPAIGKVGVWLGALGMAPAAAAREAAAEIEALGYGALWIAEGHASKEALSHAGILLAATERIVVANGIASIWARDATATAAGACTLGEAYPGRYLLGLGVSHPPQVESRGHVYARPVATMRRYLDGLDSAGYRGPRPALPVPRVLAALRPSMLRLARERADGAHPYLVPVDHTARARQILGSGKLLAVEQLVLLETDPGRARELGREAIAGYLALASYAENLLWLGFAEADLAGGGSDRLVDALVAWGDTDRIRARVREHLAVGADHVCIQPIGRTPGDLGLAQLRELAPAAP